MRNSFLICCDITLDGKEAEDDCGHIWPHCALQELPVCLHTCLSLGHFSPLSMTMWSGEGVRFIHHIIPGLHYWKWSHSSHSWYFLLWFPLTSIDSPADIARGPPSPVSLVRLTELTAVPRLPPQSRLAHAQSRSVCRPSEILQVTRQEGRRGTLQHTNLQHQQQPQQCQWFSHHKVTVL